MMRDSIKLERKVMAMAQSKNEEIIENIIEGKPQTIEEPQSRMEGLLLRLDKTVKDATKYPNLDERGY